MFYCIIERLQFSNYAFGSYTYSFVEEFQSLEEATEKANEMNQSIRDNREEYGEFAPYYQAMEFNSEYEMDDWLRE